MHARDALEASSHGLQEHIEFPHAKRYEDILGVFRVRLPSLGIG